MAVDVDRVVDSGADDGVWTVVEVRTATTGVWLIVVAECDDHGALHAERNAAHTSNETRFSMAAMRHSRD